MLAVLLLSTLVLGAAAVTWTPARCTVVVPQEVDDALCCHGRLFDASRGHCHRRLRACCRLVTHVEFVGRIANTGRPQLQHATITEVGCEHTREPNATAACFYSGGYVRWRRPRRHDGVHLSATVQDVLVTIGVLTVLCCAIALVICCSAPVVVVYAV
jgi:hypothetical protein